MGVSTQEVVQVARHHRYEGVFNVRDLGGYLGDGDRTVRWGVVYRADGIHRLPAGTLDGLSRADRAAASRLLQRLAAHLAEESTA